MRILKSISCVVEEVALYHGVSMHISQPPSITSAESAKPGFFNGDFRADFGIPFPATKQWRSYAIASVKNIVGIEIFVPVNLTTGEVLLIDHLGGPLRVKGILEPIYVRMMEKLSAPLDAAQRKLGSMANWPKDFKYKRLFVFPSRVAFNLSNTPDFGIRQPTMDSLAGNDFDVSLNGSDASLLSMDGWVRLASQASDQYLLHVE